MKQKLVLDCTVCGSPVDNGDGYIHLPYAEVRRYEAEQKDNLSQSGGWTPMQWDVFMSHKGPARWEVAHRGCDTHGDDCRYFVDIERCRTLSDLLMWTGHLWEKGWIYDTNWGKFVCEITRKNGAVSP